MEQGGREGRAALPGFCKEAGLQTGTGVRHTRSTSRSEQLEFADSSCREDINQIGPTSPAKNMCFSAGLEVALTSLGQP